MRALSVQNQRGADCNVSILVGKKRQQTKWFAAGKMKTNYIDVEYSAIFYLYERTRYIHGISLVPYKIFCDGEKVQKSLSLVNIDVLYVDSYKDIDGKSIKSFNNVSFNLNDRNYFPINKGSIT